MAKTFQLLRMPFRTVFMNAIKEQTSLISTEILFQNAGITSKSNPSWF